MNRGRGNRGGGRGGSGSGGRLVYVPKEQSPRSADECAVPGVSVDATSGSGSFRGGRKNLEIPSFDGVTKKFDGLQSSDYPHGPNSEPCGVGKFSPNDGNTKLAQNNPEAESQSSNVSSFSLSDDTIPSSSTLSELNPRHSTRNRGRGGNQSGGRGSGGRHFASKGQSPHSADHYVARRVPDGAAALWDDASSRSVSSDSPHGPNYEPCGVGNLSPNVGNTNLTQNITEAESNVSSLSLSNNDNVPSLSTPSELNHKHGTRNRGRGGNLSGGRGGAGMHYVPKGQSPLSGENYAVRRVPDGAAALRDDASSRSISSGGGRRDSGIASIDGATKNGSLLSSNSSHGSNSEPCRAGNFSPDEGNPKLARHVRETQPKPSNVSSSGPYQDYNFPLSLTPAELKVSPKIIQSQDQDVENFSPSYFSCTPSVDLMHKKQEPSLSKGGQSCREVQSGKTEFAGTSGKDKVADSDSQLKGFSLDICVERNGSVPKLKPSLRDTNRAIRNEKRQMQGDNIKVLRPGMILLESYLSLKDQVELIKSCRELGRGPGGFYEPGYRDGAKLHLKMMCLGKNWDPETSMYGEVRPVDQAKPPPIPDEFQQLVKDAILKCHCYLESEKKNARRILPLMSPNICIINYYTKTGMLGLHKDKDESQESLRKGLPVVSISLGDTAEFLYGDERDIDKADKVLLKSGDVLIFGGESRHIFHGVSTIKPDTAPKALIEETHLKPGRLNLTFREY